MILSVGFADDVAIPIWNVDDQITRAVGNALAAQAAVWRQTGRKGEFFFLGVRHLRNCFQPLSDDAVTGRARANASAGVIDIYTMREGDVQDATG